VQRIRFVALLLAALLLAAAPAGARESALLRLLDVLRQQGTLDPATYEALRQAALEEAEQPAEAAQPEPATPDVAAAAESEPAAETAEPAEPATEVRFGTKGLEVQSGEDFYVALGGRMHIDAAWYDDDDVDMGNGAELRRLRAEIEGTVWRDFDFKAGIDFAGDDVSVKSVYLTWTGLEFMELNVGRFKEPFGLEELGSSNDTLLMERASAEVFAPGRHVGVGVESYGDHWTAALGAFAGEDDFGTDDDEDSGWATTGRVTVAPFVNEGRVLHLGAAGSYRDYDKDAVLSFDIGPESHVTDVSFVDTGDIANPYSATRFGAEAAAILGPVTLQGEYIRTWIPRRMGDPDLAFDGWYVLAGWIVTGESREYRDKRGLLGSVEPRRNASLDGGFGAFELAFRYSVLDLSDEDVRGGVQDIVGVGINWYLNPNMRLMFNYLRLLELTDSDQGYDGEEPDMFQMRAQLNF
jgi:phosphate-selective porin OprO/OprP